MTRFLAGLFLGAVTATVVTLRLVWGAPAPEREPEDEVQRDAYTDALARWELVGELVAGDPLTWGPA
jgi:hypothetical protein